MSSARALATSGHRRGSTALQVGGCSVLSVPSSCFLHIYKVPTISLTLHFQMPHMKTSIPEFVDPRVMRTCCCMSCFSNVRSLLRGLSRRACFSPAGCERTGPVCAKDREGPKWLCLQQTNGFSQQGMHASSCSSIIYRIAFSKCASSGLTRAAVLETALV